MSQGDEREPKIRVSHVRSSGTLSVWDHEGNRGGVFAAVRTTGLVLPFDRCRTRVQPVTA